jgi:hypothetical protein
MRTVGIITTGAVALGVLVGLALGARFVPDVKRYVRMRSM